MSEKRPARSDAFSQARSFVKKLAKLSADHEIAAIADAKKKAADKVATSFSEQRRKLFMEVSPEVRAIVDAMPKLDAMAANPDEQFVEIADNPEDEIPVGLQGDTPKIQGTEIVRDENGKRIAKRL